MWGIAFVVVYGKKFVGGCHFLFVRHPTEPIITPALKTGDAIDHKALGTVLINEAADEAAKARAALLDAEREVEEAKRRGKDKA
jgi:hypothetical protein